MIELVYAAMVFSLLLGAGIYAFHKNWLQILIYPLMIFLAYVTMLEMPGAGKPIEWEFRELPRQEIVAHVLDEGRAIYLWLRTPGENKPKYYVRPWNDEEAEQLMTAGNRKEEMLEYGTYVNLYFYQGGNFDKDPVFYAAPPPPDPPKSQEALDLGINGS